MLTDDPEFFPSYPEPDATDTDTGASAQLLAAVSGPSVLIKTGVAMGVINLAVEFVDEPPAELDASHPWEAVTE